MRLAHRVKPGAKVRLAEIPTDDRGPFRDKADPSAAEQLGRDLERLVALQELLYADKRKAVLVVLQAMDTAGKDGVLRKVVGPLDSRGVSVVSFKAPAGEEREHDYLWRVHARTPRRGEMVFFNRSHYEDVLVPRVMRLVPDEVWRRRYDHLVAFERLLSDEGTQVVKIFLHLSKQEQRQRLQARLDDPDKRWKWDSADLEARQRWDDYQRAYEEAIERTSTDEAPWWIVPADRKWFRDLAVASVLREVLEALDPKPPQVNLDPTKIVIT